MAGIFFMIASSCILLLDSSILHKSLYPSLNVFWTVPRWLVQCTGTAVPGPLQPCSGCPTISSLISCSVCIEASWLVHASEECVYPSALCSQGLTFSCSSASGLVGSHLVVSAEFLRTLNVSLADGTSASLAEMTTCSPSCLSPDLHLFTLEMSVSSHAHLF